MAAPVHTSRAVSSPPGRSPRPGTTARRRPPTFSGARHTQWSALMAGNVLATLPLVAVFMVAQRHFVATMSFSGLKG